MPRLGGYCRGVTRYRIACQAWADTLIIVSSYFAKNRGSDYGDALRLKLFCRISCRWGPSYRRNQQRRRFAKSSRHSAGLECRLQLENQADTTESGESPPQQTTEESKRILWRWVFIVAGLANIARYNLAQDKIIYVWEVQRRRRAIKDEKERKKRLAIEAALIGFKIYSTH